MKQITLTWSDSSKTITTQSVLDRYVALQRDHYKAHADKLAEALSKVKLAGHPDGDIYKVVTEALAAYKSEVQQ